MTSKEIDPKLLEELMSLKDKPLITLEISQLTVWELICQLQLALRHPANTGAVAQETRAFVETIINTVPWSEPIKKMFEMGWHEENDIDVAIEPKSDPDPAWDYYEIHHNLTMINNKITEALQLISTQEKANNETDTKIRNLLSPHTDDISDIVDDLNLSIQFVHRSDGL